MKNEEIKFKRFMRGSSGKNFSKSLKNKKMSFLMRETNETSEIILDDTQMTFRKNDTFPANKIYLFQRVNREARKFVENNKFEVPEAKKFTDWQDEKVWNFKNKVVGIDLNHAYWRIAYLNGIISEDTYLRGLSKDCKALRLATISILGREKRFARYENGVKVDTFVTQKMDPEMRRVYDFVRYTSVNYMDELKSILDKDWLAYKTDAIYFKDSELNLNTVKSYFNSKGLTYKVLK